MSSIHIVRPGENLTTIARSYGVTDWRTIYEHANNSDLRRKRPNPNHIAPGDTIFIPVTSPGTGATRSPNTIQDRTVFESSMQSLEAEVAAAGTYTAIDVSTRNAYMQQVKAMADDLRIQASNGKITWSQAAAQSQEARNVIMDTMRGRSSPIGRAFAEQLKREGKTLNELIARKSGQLFGPQVSFQSLSTAQKNAVYAEIVKSAGKSNARVNGAMRKLSRAGRGLLVVSLALSTYEIMTAENKLQAAERELAVTGAGIGGGIAGGAMAGLACGPGAPVCVAVGAFVGGVVTAFGVDYFW